MGRIKLERNVRIFTDKFESWLKSNNLCDKNSNFNQWKCNMIKNIYKSKHLILFFDTIDQNIANLNYDDSIEIGLNLDQDYDALVSNFINDTYGHKVIELKDSDYMYISETIKDCVTKSSRDYKINNLSQSMYCSPSYSKCNISKNSQYSLYPNEIFYG